MDDTAEALDEMVGLVVRHLTGREGLSMTALACMSRLQHEGPLRLTTLATAEAVSQPSMSQLVQRLERQGLVSRIADPEDGRASLVALTEPGRALLAERRAARHQRLADLLAVLPDEDAAALRLAMTVALPVVRRLVDAARHPSSAAAEA
ncbi:MULTISPECIES: MarR family transcriptional regulator [Amycolatopsis]|uniref:MarR family transcriptional regulator n=1 Tax=Amycolatopsis bullii TaxID=941987 RepID=A0ABQ3JX12_9PSEU|nr:MarR family transcriptional regulator [Amycolatopsis bullii]GHF93891.1 MarR family transcriptional regulator [Amycolatopsis bullii]